MMRRMFFAILGVLVLCAGIAAVYDMNASSAFAEELSASESPLPEPPVDECPEEEIVREIEIVTIAQAPSEPVYYAAAPELLLLVNAWNAIPEDYEFTFARVGGGFVDERCASDLTAMLKACREAGYTPYVCSAYRSRETQEYLYNRKIYRLIAEGTDPDAAPDEAAKVVARPGTSEHEIGLAVDILDAYYTYMDQTQEERETQKWLMEHSWEYGFILRYPSDKCDVTGIIYEPWHYRYVGREDAAQMHELGVCLEEYLLMLSDE